MAYSFVAAQAEAADRGREPQYDAGAGRGDARKFGAGIPRENSLRLSQVRRRFRKTVCGVDGADSKARQQAPFELFRRLEEDDVLLIDLTMWCRWTAMCCMNACGFCRSLRGGIGAFPRYFFAARLSGKVCEHKSVFLGRAVHAGSVFVVQSRLQGGVDGSAMQRFHGDELRKEFPGWEGSFTRMPEEIKVFAPSLDGKNAWREFLDCADGEGRGLGTEGPGKCGSPLTSLGTGFCCAWDEMSLVSSVAFPRLKSEILRQVQDRLWAPLFVLGMLR